MVVLNKIYTRTGDAGTTALGTGERVSKSDLRIAAIGTIDETNASIGFVRSILARTQPDISEIDGILSRIQNDLFDLGADLCIPEQKRKIKVAPLRITQAQVKRLESQIDALNSNLSPLNSFILPGGTEAAAALHVARGICRRGERLIVELSTLPGELVNPPVLQYINRLSDLLFVASRFVNSKGEKDVLWIPGENR